MLSQATLTADIIKQMAVNAVNSTQPFAFYYGTVTSVDPIEIEIDQKLKLGEKQLIFSTLVQDFDVDMYMEHEVEETDLIHKHDASIVITSPHGDTGTITVQNSPDSDKHIHEYKGVKTFTLNLKLAKDEKVLLLRIQGGQKFLVLDRVRVLNDTEFSSEFEGEGSTGSSGGSSSDSGSSDSGNGGDSSGGTDSGNGDNGSTDDTNPDSGNNNIGGAIGNAISVTALMTALLALTPEQKEEIGLSGVKIDDENISSETTYSSQKIDDEIKNAVDSNGFEIANLEETTELSNECCLPILQGEETKKVKVETLQNELNFATVENLETETKTRKESDENLQSQIDNSIINEVIDNWVVTKFPKTKTLIAHRFLTIAPPPLLLTTQVYTVNFPYEMSDKFFNFQYSLSINGTTISNILECDSGANNARTTKSTALFITYNSATSKFNIGVNVCVIGTYK